MQILSVNVGEKRTQPNGDRLETTGIYKIPTAEPVNITTLGIPEDVICDQKFHGGPDQAIYLYGAPDYHWWSDQLGQVLAPGTFGENLTLSDFESVQTNIGDRLHIGPVILELAAPRFPCSTLAARMRDPMFVKKYRQAERPGMYCRVIQEGTVQAGADVVFVPCKGEAVATIDVFRDHYARHRDAETLRRFLRAPLAIRTRLELERDLQILTTEG